ncbi:MAG: hypothetical protein ISS31_08955 [Kiritimatiellae bacterium]|nr:hypothetical protein [Kiritimatiellia bacterium]
MGGFHNPDISITVLRRRAADQLMDCLFWYGHFLETCRWRGMWTGAFPTNAAYRSAVCRLRKQGLLVSTEVGRFSQLALSDNGKRRIKRLHRPEEMWRRDWPGYWYMLIYDVPESSRKYRDVLRGFLKKQNLGCLQKSIYVTPTDIRPDFADLTEAVQVDHYAYLFESRTVLGLDPMQIVRDAWNWSDINAGHKWYLRRYEAQLASVEADRLDVPALQTLAREEMSAYVTVMDNDPLLPRALLPQAYLGGAVFNTHIATTEAIASGLKARA